MLNFDLTKLAQRTTRTFACGRCKTTIHDVYWFQALNGNKVVVARTEATAAAAKGQTVAVPTDAIHACFVPDVTGERVQKSNPAPAPVPAPDVDVAPVPAPAPDVADVADVDVYVTAPAPAPAPDTAVAGILAQLAELLSRPAIDRDAVEAIVREVVAGVVFPTKTIVVRDGAKADVTGLTHKSLARVIAAVGTGEDVMLVGPAGTGKSHMARQVAEALALPFYTLSSSLTAQTGESKFTGFVDANGTFHGTEVYAWANNPAGGIFCLDEMDNGNPNITGWWNAVLANREVTFPNGTTVKLTANHRVIGTANTFGFGRTREFVGRNPMDAATRNRFTFITIVIDDALEAALVHGTGVKTSTADRVLAYVRGLRHAADAEGVTVVLSPRNSVRMARLLTTDEYDWSMAVEDGVRAGIPDEVWTKLERAAKAS